MTALATYAEGSGSLEFADRLGRAPKRGRRRRVRDEWPTGIRVEVPLLPTTGPLPCADGDPDAWTERFGSKGTLKALCRECPLRTECLAYGLKWDVSGVWGGRTSYERASIRWKSELPPPLPVTLGRTDGAEPTTQVAEVPDSTYLAVAAGHYEHHAIERDERSAAAMVRSASPAPTDAPEWADDDMQGVEYPERFATDCMFCCRTGIHDLVAPTSVVGATDWHGLHYKADYKCERCGCTWSRRWRSIYEAQSSATAHKRMVQQMDKRACIGRPLTDVVTRLGSRIRSVTTDDDGRVVALTLH